MSERYIEICTTPTTTTADNNDDKDDNDDGVYRQYYCQTWFLLNFLMALPYWETRALRVKGFINGLTCRDTSGLIKTYRR